MISRSRGRRQHAHEDGDIVKALEAVEDALEAFGSKPRRGLEIAPDRDNLPTHSGDCYSATALVRRDGEWRQVESGWAVELRAAAVAPADRLEDREADRTP